MYKKEFEVVSQGKNRNQHGHPIKKSRKNHKIEKKPQKNMQDLLDYVCLLKKNEQSVIKQKLLDIKNIPDKKSKKQQILEALTQSLDPEWKENPPEFTSDAINMIVTFGDKINIDKFVEVLVGLVTDSYKGSGKLWITKNDVIELKYNWKIEK